MADSRSPLAHRAGADAGGLTMMEVLARYWRFAKEHYGQRGEADNIRLALRPLKRIYGHTPANEFGPLALKSLQQRMIAAGQSRNYINLNIGRIKRMFKWAASEQLLPVTVYQALATVAGLQRGRSKARNGAREVRGGLRSRSDVALPAAGRGRYGLHAAVDGGPAGGGMRPATLRSRS